MNVVILDTGCANLHSVKSAVARHGYNPQVSRDPDVALMADKLFCPASAPPRRRWTSCASANLSI